MRNPVFILMVILYFLSAALPLRAVETEYHSRGAKIARWLSGHGMSQDAAVAAISTLPIVELRGAVPAGHILYDVPEKPIAEKVRLSLWIFLLAVAGNMIPIPFILLLLGPLSRLCMKVEPCR